MTCCFGTLFLGYFDLGAMENVKATQLNVMVARGYYCSSVALLRVLTGKTSLVCSSPSEDLDLDLEQAVSTEFQISLPHDLGK